MFKQTLLASALAAAFAVPAMAQTPGATLPVVTVSGKVPSYVVDDASAATRTGTPIERVPQSVVVIPRTVIQDQGSQTLSDVLRNVSNVTAIDARDANLTPFRIRGFAAATILDGVPVPGTFQNQQSLTGVEQVTVIKGPAGGLYGGSQGMNYPTQGGAIVITTAEPEQTPIRQLGLGLGNFNQRAVSFDLNQPLGPMFAIRLTGEYSDKDSETDRVYLKRRTLSPSLSFTPGPDTKVVLRLRDTQNETLDYPGLPRARAGSADVMSGVARNRFIAAEGLPATNNDTQSANLQWTQKLGKQWDFSLTLAQSSVKLMEVGAFNASVIDSFLAPFGLPAAFGQVTQDVYGYRLSQKFDSTLVSPALTGRLSTGNVQHTLTAGIDHEVSKEDAFMRWSDPFGFGLSPIASGLNLAGSGYVKWLEPTGNSLFDDAYVRRFKATTTYVQDQARFGPFSILASVRFNQLELENTALGKTTVKSSNHTTPRLGAVYAFSPQVSAFAGYGEAVQTPYLTTFAAGVTPAAEESKQTELGVRLKNLAGVSASFALFDLKRRNMATSGGFANYMTDQGSQGLDVDLRYQVNPSWQWLAAYTSQKATYTGTAHAQVASFVGKQLFNVPNQQLRLASRYDARSGAWQGWGLGLGLTWQSELPGDGTNSFFTPATTVWDAQVSYQTRNARYGVAVSNLLDAQYFVPSAYFGGGQLMPAAPRTITASAVFSF